MMDDRFMNELRRAPRREFARDLRTRLGQDEESATPRWRPVLTFAVGALVVAVAFTFPAVRSSAQAFLDLFRVRSFTAVSFNPERLEQLHQSQGDNALMVFDHQEVLREPGPPQTFTTPQAATAALGATPLVPERVPGGLTLEKVQVTGEGVVRLAVSSDKLRTLLETLDIDDVQIPSGLDGKTVTVRRHPSVMQTYANGKRRATLIQTRSPEVGLPAGLELERLGEIGLRILGLDRGEAQRLAHSIDWRSTLVVPVPMDGGAFREVSVRGQRGLLVTKTTDGGSGSGGVLLWSEGDQVFALSGNLSSVDMMEMAGALR